MALVAPLTLVEAAAALVVLVTAQIMVVTLEQEVLELSSSAI
jgi:hypothetical protein